MIRWAFVCLIASTVYSLDLNSEDIPASTFLIYPPLYLCSNGSFSLEFRRTGHDGLLFYSKDQLTNESILVAIDQNRLLLEFIIAKNKSLRRFDHPLHDHQWYDLLVQQHASPSTTEIILSSPALYFAESQIAPRHLSFSALHSRSFVYIAGVPPIVSASEKLIYPSFQGVVRNIRYGLCGHARQSRSALFSTSPLLVLSEQSVSLCANSALDCINGDTTLSSECDCLVKPCHSTSTLIHGNLTRLEIDFTANEFQSQSNRAFFGIGTEPYRFSVHQGDDNQQRTADGIRLDPTKLITLLPAMTPKARCLWDLNECSSEWTFTIVLSMDRSNQSSTVFQQHGFIHIHLAVENSSASLQFDLCLSNGRGCLRTHLKDFPYHTPLFLELTYQPLSQSSSLSLFGQRMDYTTETIKDFSKPFSFSSSPSIQLGKYDSNLPSAAAQIRSIAWSNQPSTCRCCPSGSSRRLNRHRRVVSSRCHYEDDNDIADLPSRKFIPSVITEYPLPVNVRTKYFSDEESYVLRESIIFAFRTNQEISEAITLLAGLVTDRIYYAFDIEDGRVKLFFTEENLPDLVLTSNKTHFIFVNDGQWHRLRIERVHRKLRFYLDEEEQSAAVLPDSWHANRNLFIGAELTPVPRGGFAGAIGDIKILKSDRALNLREEDFAYDDGESLPGIPSPLFPSALPAHEEIFPPMTRSPSSSSSGRISFLPRDNQQIIVPSPVQSPFRSFSMTFRAQNVVCTVVQFDPISLIIDADGYLALVIRHQQAHRIFAKTPGKSVNDGHLHTIQLQLVKNTLQTWMDPLQKSSIDLLPMSSFVIERFIFGSHNQYLGCIEHVMYNDHLFSFAPIAVHRQQCPLSHLPTDQILSFEDLDRPLTVLADQAEDFQTLSFFFSTSESNSFLCALTDLLSDNAITISLRQNRLFFAYRDEHKRQMDLLANYSIDQGKEHQLSLKFINTHDFIFQLDKHVLMRKLPGRFPIAKFHFGQLDGSNSNVKKFLGCMRDIRFNGKPLLKPEQIHPAHRLSHVCRTLKHPRLDVISHLPSNVSFSIRSQRDIVQLAIPTHQEFDQYDISIRTRSSSGFLTSFYSTADHRALRLSLVQGRLQINYERSKNVTSHIIFNDYRPLNDGQPHQISLQRSRSIAAAPSTFRLQVDQHVASVSIPDRSTLVFDQVIIGGLSRSPSNQTFIGCLANVVFNHHALVPRELIPADRHDCFYRQDSMCDRRIPCSTPAVPFCGDSDCSLVCPGIVRDIHQKGLVRYYSRIGSSPAEEISLMILTTSSNATLLLTLDGSTQVSIILQNSHPQLLIRNGALVDTYAFPDRIRAGQWSRLQLRKTFHSIELTLDDERRSYQTTLASTFSFFGDGKIYLCGQDFFGYLQDILLQAADQRENLIVNGIDNPGLIDYDSTVSWNNRAVLPERTPCARIQCLNGGYCIQPSTQATVPYCHCPSQYSGYRCEQSAAPDLCSTYQCNHGTCHKDRSNQPYCSCYEGYGGPRCETQIDPCARVNCNQGRCELDRGIAVCRCYHGYSGSDCLTVLDACARVSCNYGTCINEVTSYRCECQRGYEGSACDRAPDPCSSFVCYNGGLCHLQQNQQPVCQCVTGYRGTNCYDKDADPCLRYDCYGGTCTNERGVPRCICPTGRIGSRCQDDICAMYPCANNGQCVPEGGSRRCICVNPYYGDECREVYRPNPCDNVHCNYGQCRDGLCECHSGYTGAFCDIPPDLCASINCNYGMCYEGRCQCSEGYTGGFCETPISTTTLPPVPIVATTSGRLLLTAKPVGLAGPKTGQLIDYGRLLGARGPGIGWILGLVGAFLLIPLALAFAARQCTQGACVPVGGPGGYIPVKTGATGVTQTEGGARNTVDLKVLDQRDENLAAASNALETTRIEQTREIVREYGGMEAAGGGAAVFSTYPTMSSRYGDFARDNQQQQTSAAFSQQHVIEADYHAPPVADFGYGRGGLAEGFRDTFESWETSGGGGGGGGGYSMNAMFGEGGLQTDYELSNINSVSMTPNGKYAIVGQSQGPPQIWDAINGQLVSSMQGISHNCSKVALACSGTLLVGLANEGVDSQSSILQIWDVNTGKPVQLTHQIKCATFALSNNSSNLVMAGNQKYGRGISVGILDLNNSELTKEIKSDTNQSYGATPSFVTLTPDERYAIVGCAAGSATNYVVFDLTTQQELVQPLTINIDAEPQCSLVLNNEQIVTGTRNGQLVLWNVASCQRLHTLNDNGQSAHRDRITDLKISPDRGAMVSTSADGTAKIWDTQSKELISRLIGHKREITCGCISTNQLVATGSKDQTICLWRLQTGQVASTMPVGMTPLDIHMAAHNRTVVAIGDKDGERQLLMLRVVSIQR